MSWLWMPFLMLLLACLLAGAAAAEEDVFFTGSVDPQEHKYRECTHVPLPATKQWHKPESRWVNAQVQYWYGDLYPLVAAGQWGEFATLLAQSPYYFKRVKGMLSFNDTTEAKVAAKYGSYGAYRHHHNAYILCDILQHAPATKPFTAAHRFPVLMVDMVGPLEPVIASRRSINPGTELAVMWPWPYHLALARKGLADNRPFSGKKSLVVFRGALSGPVRHVRNSHFGKTKTSRLGIVHTWANATWADLGISLVPEHQKSVVDSDPKIQAQVRAVTKPSVPLSELMQYKYVLCIEGADISSGFGWVLASNSVPFHPYPFLHHVWFFNGLLPWVHFVPILPDGSDLQTAYQWCETHADECAKIAQAGRQHMMAMLNPDYISAVKTAVVSLWDLKEGAL